MDVEYEGFSFEVLLLGLRDLELWLSLRDFDFLAAVDMTRTMTGTVLLWFVIINPLSVLLNNKPSEREPVRGSAGLARHPRCGPSLLLS